MKLLPALPVFLFLNCNTGQSTTANQEKTVMDKAAKTDTVNVSNTSANKQDTKTKLIGAWTDGSTENATFDIQQDSIFYVDQLTSYKYTLADDSIKIYYPDWTFTGVVNFSNDTLVITGEEGTTKYWKFNN